MNSSSEKPYLPLRYVSLEPLAENDVDACYSLAFEKAGLALDQELRREASRATMGSPYILQLMGYNIIRYAGERSEVTSNMLKNALEASRISFEQGVCQATLAALSDRDIGFLEAMSIDEGPSRISAIAKRMGVTDDYAQKYRRRLI